jgi:hypothetical protein
VLLALGFMIDAFSGFYILRNAKSLSWSFGGLVLVAVFYLLGETCSEWISSKDDVSHPLHKRSFHLICLLLFAGAIIGACWFAFKLLGW